MALIQSNLQQALRQIMDPEYSSFQGFPANNVEVASVWSTIINDYANLVTPPSTTFLAAKTAFSNVMLAVDPNLQNGLTLLQVAFSAYALALIPGMLPAYVATPPPFAINFSSLSALGLSGASGDQTSALLASIIDTWFKTGSATPTVPGPTIPWS